MNFEPQKFFIGLMDFFSILLPGALLTFLLRLEMEAHWAAHERIFALVHLPGAKGWVVFLVFSYLLGHFAFLLGAWLDELYDWFRDWTQNRQITHLLRRGQPVPWLLRALVWLVFKKEHNLAVDRVGKIKRHYLAPLQAQKTINNFQWCKALLTVESPESLPSIQRFEADSKFFRCFVIVLMLMILLSPHWHYYKLIIVAVVLLPLAMWRYMEQRFKSTNQAYWFVIAWAQKAGLNLEKEASVDAGLTHAGGVVFWRPWLPLPAWTREVRYLLVESSDFPVMWVLPKGKIEEGEDPKVTAVREVHEETGVWASIDKELRRQSYPVKGKMVSAQIFLMKRAAGGFPNDRKRKRQWLTLGEIESLLKDELLHPETHQLLTLANTMVEPNQVTGN